MNNAASDHARVHDWFNHIQVSFTNRLDIQRPSTAKLVVTGQNCPITSSLFKLYCISAARGDWNRDQCAVAARSAEQICCRSVVFK
jgi:hypothetical protein